jgi:hypothetical protein
LLPPALDLQHLSDAFVVEPLVFLTARIVNAKPPLGVPGVRRYPLEETGPSHRPSVGTTTQLTGQDHLLAESVLSLSVVVRVDRRCHDLGCSHGAEGGPVSSDGRAVKGLAVLASPWGGPCGVSSHGFMIAWVDVKCQVGTCVRRGEVPGSPKRLNGRR